MARPFTGLNAVRFMTVGYSQRTCQWHKTNGRAGKAREVLQCDGNNNGTDVIHRSGGSAERVADMYGRRRSTAGECLKHCVCVLYLNPI
jgi:hypothetical protein